MYGVLFVCVSMYCAPLRKPEQGVGSPGTGLTDGYIFALILTGTGSHQVFQAGLEQFMWPRVTFNFI